jgi:hypothetical protein
MTEAARATDQQDILPIIDSVRRALGEEAYQQAWQTGHAMTTQQAIAFALDTSP